MKRVLVTGFPGAGKTAFTSWMESPEVIHLDDLIQRDGDPRTRSRRTKEAILGTLENRKAWIAEGAQGLRLLPDLIPITDLVIFIHGGDRNKFHGAAKWWLRLKRASRDKKVRLWEVL